MRLALLKLFKLKSKQEENQMSKQGNREPFTNRFSPHASLAALGLKLTAIDLFGPIKELVKIDQKSVKYTPIEKLQDAFIAILAGARGLVEINTRLRSDTALQRAFGRNGCAEQSVVQETLTACNSTNVAQMVAATKDILQLHSLAYKHDYCASYQLLDVDVTGLPCGPKAEAAKKGYCGGDGIRYNRQLGRVIAAYYEEIIVDCLYPGNIYLAKSLRWLVEAAEERLGLDEAKRQRTILRVDAGGGNLETVNWMLERGYQIHCKDVSTARAEAMARTVTQWVDDPKHPGRQLGWVNDGDGYDYARPIRRLAIRWPKNNGKFKHAMLLSTLEPEAVIALLKQPNHMVNDVQAVVLAYAHFYDLRGGTIEIEIKEDKQGIGIGKRSKKTFPSQQMVMLLNSLAHNVIVWSRRWLSNVSPRLARYGILRIVRDVLQISGFIRINSKQVIVGLVLNQASALAAELQPALAKLVTITIELGET
jgi:Transposase DDE domain group 1